MKSIVLIIAVLSVAYSCTTTEEKNNEILEPKIELGKSYGPAEVNVQDAISVADMLKSFEGKTEETEFTFEGELNEVCSKAGCWVT